MQSLAGHFFTEAEQKEIRQTVQEAEAETAAEIVVMVVSSSHDYPEARLTALRFVLPFVLFVQIHYLILLAVKWPFMAFLALFFIFFPLVLPGNTPFSSCLSSFYKSAPSPKGSGARGGAQFLWT